MGRESGAMSVHRPGCENRRKCLAGMGCCNLSRWFSDSVGGWRYNHPPESGGTPARGEKTAGVGWSRGRVEGRVIFCQILVALAYPHTSAARPPGSDPHRDGGRCTGGRMGLRMRVHDKEPIAQAMRRFKKLIERSGMQKELRAHQYYEKPCEQRRRAMLRKQKAARKAQGLI